MYRSTWPFGFNWRERDIRTDVTGGAPSGLHTEKCNVSSEGCGLPEALRGINAYCYP